MSCLACGQTNIGQTGEYPCAACGLPTQHDPDGADELPSYEEACAALRADGIDPDELGRRLRERLTASTGVSPVDRARRLIADFAPTGPLDRGEARRHKDTLAGAAIGLARDLIAESEAHEVTRRERDGLLAPLASGGPFPALHALLLASEAVALAGHRPETLADVAACVERLAGERDEARAELARLRVERTRLTPSTSPLRIGQRAFNALAAVEPDIADSIRATDADPFYDDGRIEAFVRALVRRP